MLMRCLLLSVLLLSLCLPGLEGQAHAVGDRTIHDASPQELVDGLSNKLVRGVANFATGWLEFPKQIYYTSKEEGWVSGLTVGPVKGVGMALGRTLTGAVEAATFFIAYPGFYDPLFDPAYVWKR